MHFLLIYDLSPDYMEKRGQYRDEHLRLAWQAHKRGELELGGALADPADQAILFFTGDSPLVVERFVEKDPYVYHGLVKQWQIRTWTTVVGEKASHPVKPEK
jgi:uncharacterized protein